MQAYKYNYDYYTTNPKKLIEPEVKQEHKFKVLINKNYKRNKYLRLLKRLKRQAILSIAVKTVILLSLITAVLTVNASATIALQEASYLESEISELSAEIDYLNKSKMLGISDVDLQNKARAMGMQEPVEGQIVWLFENEENAIIMAPSKWDNFIELCKTGCSKVSDWWASL